MAVYIDNDNTILSVKDQTGSTAYDIEKMAKDLGTEGNMVIGRVYLNPGTFSQSRLMHVFWEQGFQPVYAASYHAGDTIKSLADPQMVLDIQETLYERPSIEKFVIASGDKDFVPVIRKLREKEKEVILMYIEGSEAEILRKDAERLGIKQMEVPIRRRAASRTSGGR